MKTRQEMIYDFMVALSVNPEIYKDWDRHSEVLGSYGEHVNAIAEEMADKYLENA